MYTLSTFNVKNNIDISIVMTTNNRSIQTLFTLKIINKKSIDKNITVQIIIIDDSQTDLIDIYQLKELTNLQIDYIKINNEKKNWINPCVNYNIGFEFVKGNKIIIQNAEVCHVGNILSYVNTNVTDNNYYIFDVKSIADFKYNNVLYDLYFKDNTCMDNINIYNNNLYNAWYQYKNRNYMMHFLSALSKKTFDKIKNFDNNYKYATDYDDNDFILKIVSLNIKCINVFHDENNIGGIHQCHHKSLSNPKLPNNKVLFTKKIYIFNKHNKYIDDINELNKYDIDLKLINLREEILIFYKNIGISKNNLQ